jgi:EAL domain-containing protein (putative c-di-GMP-specific phosphodiesterase class I)
VLAALQEPFVLNDNVIDLGGSIGLALAPEHGNTVRTLLKRADVAMYAAKQTGRAVVVYDPAQDTASPNRLALVAALRQAVVNDRLDVHVQPKVSIDTGAVIGAEALVRWRDDERGAVPPDEFIPVAERSGLIRPLTEIVLRRSLQACADWQRVAPGVGVAVNLSARSLRDPSLVDDVASMLRAFGVPGHLLTIEITESSVMADPASTLELLHRLRALSVQLSIDDFGTGYSSLSYLRRLPVQEVKIDKSFVWEMDQNAEDAAIVRSIVELGHTLDMHVVAEGIERASVFQLLREFGCDLGQGYLVSKPMPAGDFVGWFSRSSVMLADWFTQSDSALR